MRCEVCGKRGSAGFMQVWRLDENGERKAGKPLFVHKKCKHLLKNVRPADAPKERPLGWLAKMRAKKAEKEAVQQ